MRIVYVDESGISNLKQDPIAVVAGIVVEADKKLIEVEKYIDHLMGCYIAEESRQLFAFHATELFSGGKMFDRNIWTRDER